MGKGKGAPDYWVANVKPGRILFEVEGVSFEEAELAFKNAGHKFRGNYAYPWLEQVLSS